MRAFLYALLFFTRLPFPQALTQTWLLKKDKAQDFVYAFALVGLCIGASQFAVAWFFSHFLSLWTSVSLSVVFVIFLSGALHEDGLADFFDGFGAGHDKESILAIMKDSRIGVYGVLALVLSVFLRVVLWTEVLRPLNISSWSLWFFLFVFTHAWSKTVMLLPMRFLVYARDNCEQTSKVKSLVWRVNYKVLVVNFFWPLILLLFFTYCTHTFSYVLATIVSFGFVLWFIVFLRRKLKGYTGDTLGALAQFTEIIFLLSLSLFSQIRLAL